MEKTLSDLESMRDKAVSSSVQDSNTNEDCVQSKQMRQQVEEELKRLKEQLCGYEAEEIDLMTHLEEQEGAADLMRTKRLGITGHLEDN